MQLNHISKISLLCIVSDNDCKNGLSEILQKHYLDHKVAFASDGVEAVICLEELNPDLIVFDMDISEYDYNLIYKTLKDNHKINHIIPLSSRATDTVLNKCTHFGLNYCLSKKPFNSDMFRLRLDLAVNTLVIGTDNDRFNQARSDFFRKPESL